MRIGELAARTDTSRRLLRYYEQQGLLTSARLANGYRDFDERLVYRVLQIRGLLDAGMPVRIIALVLPCLDLPGVMVCPDEASPELVRALEDEVERVTRRIEQLTRNRDAIATYLDGLRSTGRVPTR